MNSCQRSHPFSNQSSHSDLCTTLHHANEPFQEDKDDLSELSCWHRARAECSSDSRVERSDSWQQLLSTEYWRRIDTNHCFVVAARGHGLPRRVRPARVGAAHRTEINISCSKPKGGTQAYKSHRGRDATTSQTVFQCSWKGSALCHRETSSKLRCYANKHTHLSYALVFFGQASSGRLGLPVCTIGLERTDSWSAWYHGNEVTKGQLAQQML